MNGRRWGRPAEHPGDGGARARAGRRALLALVCLVALAAGGCGGPDGQGDGPREEAAGTVADGEAPPEGEAAPEDGEDRGASALQEVNQFLAYDAADSLVDLKLWAGYGGANSAWNFNGYYRGNATVVVPLGWRVEATYQTLDANVPHSAAVVETREEIPNSGSDVQVAFRGASTPSFVGGISSTRDPVTFRFRADEAGRYWIFCGVPGHARGGMWIWLEVSETAGAPDFRTESEG